MNGDRIWVVACSYSMAPDTLRTKLGLLGERFGVSFRGVVVANRQGVEARDDQDWTVIQGSNSTHDFSAYAEGLTHLMALHPVLPEAVLFVNDSLFESHHARENLRAVLHYLPLVRQIKVPAIGGKADRYTVVCHANPWSGLSLYVSTYCFVLNRPALPCLLGLHSMAEADGLRDDVPIDSPDWGGGVPANFLEFLRAFVVYRHPSFKWPGLDRYEISDRLLAIKVRCIYLEHRLSGEIGRDGCIVPVNIRAKERWRLYLAEKLSHFIRAGRVRWLWE